jgi:hypothetical protein
MPVMPVPGLDPGIVAGIHVLLPTARKTWMAGTSPAMTLEKAPTKISRGTAMGEFMLKMWSDGGPPKSEYEQIRKEYASLVGSLNSDAE